MKVKNQYLKIFEYLHLSFNKWPYSENSRYLLFFEKNTIMGNTADLAMVQKTIIDALQKEGKSQKVAVQGVLYQSILNAKLTGRKKLGRKMCTSYRDDASLRILSSKADSNTWESFTRSELKLESVHQESPRSDIFRKRATKPLLKQKHPQKHLGLRRKRMVLCFLKSSQRSHLPGHFRALHASFCWQALWRCWFHFPAGLGTCPHCQRYQKLVQWPWCYSA